MGRLVILWAIFTGFTSTAWAQNIVVRSGDHSTFSRLVLQIPAQTPWRLERGEGSATLTVDLPGVVFDWKEVFQKIRTDRIKGLAQATAGGPLRIDLNCECSVTAFLEKGVFVVIDVATSLAAGRPAWSLKNGLDYAYVGLPTSSARGIPRAIGQLAKPHSSPSVKTTQPPAIPPASLSEQMSDRLGLPEPMLGDGLVLSQLRLQERIARAANQGLLVPRTETRPAIEPTAGAKAPVASQNVQLLEATTRADQDRSQIRLKNATSAEDHNCVSSEIIDTSTWGNMETARQEIGHLRRALYSDTDVFQPDAALELAKFYIFLGFGSEALQLLNMAKMSGDTSDLLHAIADLMDAPPDQKDPFLATQTGCVSDITLWAILNGLDQGAPVTGPASKAALRAFSKLPDHLRAHLGPRLSRKFLDAGETSRASDVLRAIDPAVAELPVGSQAVLAEIEMQKGNSANSMAHLDDVITSGTEYSPQALVSLIELAFENRAPPKQAMSDLAAAYATELRGTPHGGDLRKAQVLALTMERRFGDAFSVLHAAKDLAPDVAHDSWSNVLDRLTEEADDLTFLSLAVQEISGPERILVAPVGNSIAARLIDLGFHDTASNLLLLPVSARKDPERRLLRAQIALEDRKPNRALVELAGLETEPAELLRAQALAMTGDHQSAAESFQKANDTENVARSRWLGGDWDLESGSDASGYADAAALAQTLNAENPVGVGQLSTARALLSASEETRVDISSLLKGLADPTVPTSGVSAAGRSP